MSKVLLTYDVHESVDHVKLKKQLLSLGWADEMPGFTDNNEQTILHLPNTTFYKSDANAESERAIFISLVPIESIIRLMVYNYDSCFGLIGLKHYTDLV